jgi:DNA mismatch endonuclease (patch repair protein)
MADIFSVTKRSEIMSRIRSEGTTPERTLYVMVREALGSRWRIDLNARALLGQPDLFIPSLRLVLFADGCFYHGCSQHGHQPKSNRKYWLPKLARNRERDSANRKALSAMGCRVWAFWEHELRGKELEKTRKNITRRIGKLVKQKRRATAKAARSRTSMAKSISSTRTAAARRKSS